MQHFSHAVGIDGCPAGWIAAEIDAQGRTEFHLCRNIQEIWENFSTTGTLLIDIPIGLNDTESGWRECDLLAREMLGFPRCCSVFAPPIRPTLSAAGYPLACEINCQCTGKKISKQCWGILPKIREVDLFLRSVPKAVGRVRECHPELAFWRLNRNKPLAGSKRSAAGMEERLVLLESYHPPARQDIKTARSRFMVKQVHTDDLIDALAAAVIGHLAQDSLCTVPLNPPKDACGLPQEIVY